MNMREAQVRCSASDPAERVASEPHYSAPAAIRWGTSVDVELLAGWVSDAGEIERVAPIVVTRHAAVVLPGPLVEISRLARRTTPRSHLRFERGAVIVYEPDERTMGFALELARGFSLAVIDSDPPRWREWAVMSHGRGADGHRVASALSAEKRDELLVLLAAGTQCGWSGHEFSQRVYAALRPRDAHVLTAKALVAAALAFGLDHRQAQVLSTQLHERKWIA